MGARSLAVTASLVLFIGLAEAYSKYGRSCSDIGCLSSERCEMAYDSCSYSQRENKDCGRYPTCKKSGSSVSSSPGASLNPMPENTRPVSSNYNPSYNNPASAPQNPYPNVYPQLPSAGQYPPQYPPQYPGQYPQNPSGQYPPGPYANGQYPNSQYPGQYPNQNPYGGNPLPQFPNYRIPTTTEPSLWNQFLYNKQGGYGYRGDASKHANLSSLLCILSTLIATILFRPQNRMND